MQRRFLLDLALVAGFALVGRLSHAESLTPAGWWHTFWPFGLGLVLGWLILLRGSLQGGSAGPPGASVRDGAVVVACTVAGGMLVRSATGQGTATAFVVVAVVVLGLLLVGSRIPGRPRSTTRERARGADTPAPAVGPPAETLDLPGVATLTFDPLRDAFVSPPVAAGALEGVVGRFLLEDPQPAVYDAAATAFLHGDGSDLLAASEQVFRYYRDTVRTAREQGWAEPPAIPRADAVWEHVSLGREFDLRREGADGPAYVSVECECTWEPEHGLQLVFREGREVTKVGPFDGHLTNASALGTGEHRGDAYVSPFGD